MPCRPNSVSWVISCRVTTVYTSLSFLNLQLQRLWQQCSWGFLACDARCCVHVCSNSDTWSCFTTSERLTRLIHFFLSERTPFKNLSTSNGDFMGITDNEEPVWDQGIVTTLVLIKPCRNSFIQTRFFFYMAQQPLFGQGLLSMETSRSHSDTPQSVWLLWTSDRPDAEAPTWQHTTLSREWRLCLPAGY